MMRDRSAVVIAACITCLGWTVGASSNPGLEQAAVRLEISELAGSTTQSRLQSPQATNQTLVADASSETATDEPENPIRKWRRVLLVLLIILAIAGGGIFLLQKWLRSPKKAVVPKFPPDEDNLRTQNSLANGIASQTQTDSLKDEHHANGHNQSHLEVSNPNHSQPQSVVQTSGDTLPVKKNTRLAKINIVDELIKDLQAPDPQKQRKAIWELAQRGDSRAVQPLVDLMIDSDSQQRSLILEALSQIGTKTLKPMNRALAVSLQDDNAEVRKNAIRDVTRIYELVAQISQMLCHAADDPDPEVQETARWAMSQLSRIRTLGTLENLPPSQSSQNLSENQRKEPPQ